MSFIDLHALDLRSLAVVASGHYRYSCDGQPQAIQEPWQLFRLEDQFILQGQRQVDNGPDFSVLAEYSNKRRCVQFLLDWSDKNNTQRLHYQHDLQADSLRWRRAGESWHSQSLTSGSLLFPLLRAAAGPLVRELSLGPRDTIVPSLHTPDQPDDFLSPRRSLRHCEAQSSEGHYRYFGGEYGQSGADYWLNPRGILSAYHWQSAHGLWEVALNKPFYSSGFSHF